ncbi:MAG: 50S ribosomal protein L23 [Planctomycetota bacterium]
MEPHHIVKKPLITEKHTLESSELNRYAFEVTRTARKDEIKAAIESLYGVRVVGVNTAITKGGQRRYRYGVVTRPRTKKAIVRVHPEDRIELF